MAVLEGAGFVQNHKDVVKFQTLDLLSGGAIGQIEVVGVPFVLAIGEENLTAKMTNDHRQEGECLSNGALGSCIKAVVGFVFYHNDVVFVAEFALHQSTTISQSILHF